LIIDDEDDPGKAIVGVGRQLKISRRGSLRALQPAWFTGQRAMRLSIFCFLVVLFGSSLAPAGDPAFEQKIAIYVSAHSSAFPESLKARGAEIQLDLTIGREGKLLNAGVPKNVASAADEASILAALRRIQPFPPVPENLPAPYNLSAVFVFVPSVSAKHKDGGVCRGC
jgi:hypothetical protein